MSLCPASEDKQPVTQRKKENAKPVNDDEQIQEAKEPKLERVKKSHDKITTVLASSIYYYF